MYNIESQANLPITLMILGSNPTTLPNSILFNNGAIDTSTSVVINPIGQGNIFKVVITPTSTGQFAFYANGEMQASLNVVTKSLYSSIQDLLDESLGSWSWDKTTGDLSMLRQDGSVLAYFKVEDTLSVASRERI